MKFWGVLSVCLLLWRLAYGVSGADFAKFFEVDLEQDELPSMSELDARLAADSDYNRKYDSPFDLDGEFDIEFRNKIAAYGGQEKRIAPQMEELLYDVLQQFPQKYYQYIGPQLFKVPQMSERILNMPGIKETKNQFPTRIADELRDMEDLEFLSPSLYFLLMPEAWPGYEEEIEHPREVNYTPKIKYDPEFYKKIRQIVPPENYMPNMTVAVKDERDGLRTVFPKKDMVLTAADVQAIAETITPLEEWLEKDENLYAMYRTMTLLSLYERDDELGQYANSEVRNMVNPCARLVQQARIAGKENELFAIVAKKGFTLNEWAYTCDKTVKAYRLSQINYALVQVLRLYQRGAYDELYAQFSAGFRNSQLAMMQAIIKAYQAPVRDVLAVKKNRHELDEMFKHRGYTIFGHPLFFD